MRKNLIIIAILGLSLLLSLIIFNLFQVEVPKKKIGSSVSALADIATPTDIAWLKTPTPELTIPEPLPLKINNIAPINIETNSSAAIQAAPISSNQIQVEIQKQELVSKIPDASLQNPVSPYVIQTGTMIPAILITGINSDLKGPLTAQVRANVYDSIAGRYLLIPQGSKLLGNYDANIIYGQKRLLVTWRRIIFPNGKSINLGEMPGVDVSGYTGFNDIVKNNYFKTFSSTLLMSIIGAGLQLSQPQESANNNGVPSVNQILAQNVAMNLSQTSLQILQKNLNIQPTLEIRPGYLFNVSVIKDLVIENSES